MNGLAKFYFFLLFSCLISCQRARVNASEIAKGNGLVLSSNEMLQMLSLIKPYDNTKLNIHVRYLDRFNDSTVMMEIVQNQFLPNRKNIFRTFSYSESRVFVYDSLECSKINMTDSLMSNDTPFNTNDSPLWTILVKRRLGNFLYFNVSIIPVYDESSGKDTMPWEER